MNDVLKNYGRKSKIDEAMHTLNAVENGGLDPYYWESRNKIPTCPHCGHEMTAAEIASLMRKLPSEKRTAASRTNGKKGGRPKGSKNKPKSPS